MRNFRDRHRNPGGLLAARRGGGAPWTPASLSPYAWYDAHLGGSAAQITDSSANARAAVTNGAAAAAATWLPYSAPAVYLTGVASNYISAPDSAALSFSNDIEVVCRIKCVDWSAAANQTIAGKYVTTGNQRSWRFYVSTTGTVALTASADGTAVVSCTVTPSVALTDNSWVWLRLRLDLTNGSNSVGTVDTAADTGNNEDLPTSWTANGSATSTALAGIFDGTAPLEIGSFGTGASERFNGWVGRMIVKSGFDGTTVADFNASLCGQTGYTATSPAITWTVNRSTAGLKSVVQSPAAGSTRGLYLLATDDYLDVPAAGIPVASSVSVVAVARFFATAVDFGYVADIRANNGNNIQMQTNSGVAGMIVVQRDGTNFVDLYPSGTVGQRFVTAGVVNGRSTFTGYVNNSSSSASNASVLTTLSSPYTGAIGKQTGGAAHAACEFEALLTFDRALSASEIGQLVTYYRGGS